jgi:hypothetical protein
MSEWPARLSVARWEFLRFMKPNQLAVSFVLMLLMGALGYGVARLARNSSARVTDIAVIGGRHLGIERADTVNALALRPASASALDSLRGALVAREVDGILIVTGVDSARLIVRRSQAWQRSLDAHLSGLRQRLRLSEAGLPPERLAFILAPVNVATEFQSGNDGRAARIAAFVAVALVLYGVFTAMA